MEDIVQEYTALTQEDGVQSTEGETAVPVEQPASDPIENVEYILGEKQDKLPVNAEFNVTHDGKVLRVPLSKILNSFRMRSKLDDDIRGYKTEREKFEQERGPLEDFNKRQADLAPLSEFNDWSKKLQGDNPSAYQHLYDTIDQMKSGLWQAGGEQSNEQLVAASREIASLRNDLKGLNEWKGQWEAEKENTALESDMAQVKEDAKAFQERYQSRGIDLNKVGDNGLTLEHQIIKYAAENGINSFKAAALELLEDQLLEKAKQEGQTEAVKQVQKDRAAGIVAKSSTPFTGQGAQVDVTKLTGEEVRDNATEEFKSLLSSET